MIFWKYDIQNFEIKNMNMKIYVRLQILDLKKTDKWLLKIEQKIWEAWNGLKERISRFEIHLQRP